MKEKISLLSVFINAILSVIKITAGFFTHSSSVLAEGFHSLMDVFSSAIGFLGIRASKKPVDEKHPYGHYKIEVLSGVVITIILFVTGVSIAYEFFKSFVSPSEIVIGFWALLVMGLSAIINEIMSRVKIYYGKKEGSFSLLSDGVHSRVDVFTSLAVFLGIILNKYWVYTDSLFALCIGIYIILESFKLGKEAADSLLDVSAGPEIEKKIKNIALAESVKIDSLKTQKKGSAITANLEIKLPSGLDISKATIISDKLKEKLLSGIESLSYVAIQIKGSDINDEFYRPLFGKGFGWQRKNQGKGPGGICVCKKCGYKKPHNLGAPCSEIKCPKCNINLERE